MEKSLSEALKTTPAQLYGGGNGDCAAIPGPACFDANRPTETAGVTLGSFPYQNRPTFQQVVTPTVRLPR